MAILLSTSYQQIATISLTYGEIRFYGRYYEQSKEGNYTNYQLKMTYYTWQNTLSFSSADAWMDSSHKQYGNTTFYKGETVIMEEVRYTPHNEDGTSQILTVGVSWSATFGGGGSATADIYFPKIDRYPILTSAPNFNDEENPTITYTTTMGFSNATLSACISITGATDDVPYRTINVSDGSYTFNLTNAERTTLRQACQNSKTLQVTFFLRTIANGTPYYSTLTRTMSIINGEPTFTTTITETNQDVITILGGSSATNLIKNVSEAQVVVTPTAYKEATISGVVINNTTITTSPYQTTIVPTSGNFNINVIDSRGYQTAGVETRNLIDYEKVKINSFSFERENPTSSNIMINLDCVYYSLSGDNLNNPVTVQYKLNDGSFVTIPSSNYVIDNTNHRLKIIDYQLSNALNYRNQGEFTIKINDSLSETSDKMIVIKGIPTMDLGEHDLQVNGDLYIADTDRENEINVLDKINNLLEWNYIGQTTGNSTINLPSSFHEILCIAKVDNNNALQLLIQVPYIHLTSSSQSFNSGYYGASSVSGYVRAVISKTTGNLSNAYQNGTQKLTTTVAMWYYR